MNIHEYQAKNILKEHKINIQEGVVAENLGEALEGATFLKNNFPNKSDWLVVKAQVHSGGRGKGGGVKLAKDTEELKKRVSDILGMKLVTPQTGKEGKIVHKVLIAQDVYYPGEHPTEEYYLSILMDRSIEKNVIVYSTEGGTEIEITAEENPELIHKEIIEPGIGLMPNQARKIAFNLGLTKEAYKQMVKFVTNIYKAYEAIDASLIEVNPILKTSDNKIVAVDAKVNLDDNGLYRHPELEALRDVKEEDPMETEAREHNMSFIKLDGNVGCLVNGAGLAMATMDIIKHSGAGNPANFLDLGGTADKERVERAIKLILKDKNVQGILINIFGGIVRCDIVAQGIVDAYKSIGEIPVPLIVRLQGNNADKGKKIIEDSGLKIHPAILLKDAAELIAKVI